MLILDGCAGGAGSGVSVYTFGGRVDLDHFEAALELNTDAIPGDLIRKSSVSFRIENDIARILNEKYKNVTAYTAFLITASPEELKMSNHQALLGRGYTYLLVAAINPGKSHPRGSGHNNNISEREEIGSSASHSMNISCTVYRLSDGMPISIVNIDAYNIEKDFWGRDPDQKDFSAETDMDRWRFGSVYSCDKALKAVI